MRRIRHRLHRTGGMLLAACLAAPVFAQTGIIDDVRITSDADRAVIELQFACDMRFVADTATSGGALLEVRVAPFDSCVRQGLVDGISGESFVPLGAAAAHLLTIEFDSLGLGDSIVLLTFDQPVSYAVRQGANLREVEIVVDLNSAPARRPLTSTVVAPATASDYIINLQSTREPVGGDAIEGLAPGPGLLLYDSQIRVDGVLWHRLRIGFFASEADAEAMLTTLVSRFPRAWIGRAEPAEIAAARESTLAAGGGLLTFEETAPASAAGQDGAAPEPFAAAAVPGAMADARERMLDGDYGAAIRVYRRLAQTPGDHRAEATEFLGLAYERSGDLPRARSEYQRYLREFPSGAGRARVQQRLDSSIVAVEAPRESLRESNAADGPAWEFGAGLAQYYRRDQNRFDQDLPVETTQSALLTDGDFSLQRSGRNVDAVARLSFTHYYDLLDPAEGGRGDWNRVSYAYVDVAENQQQWALRLGRQTLHNWGVLGRFDGAHFSYGIGADKRLHLTTGFPVESTRDSVQTDREFAGLAVEFVDLVGTWDLATFVNSESLEGVAARRAAGVEVRYFDERKSVTGMLDYDVDWGELNSFLLLGTLRLDNRVTFSALVDQRRSPILSLRNALIGQPVQTLAEMLIVWSEDEVRGLALDRSPESDTVTLGLAAPLGERLQLNFDVTSAEIDGTPASGGVAAFAGTGPQLFYSASFVATGLMAGNDVNIWNFRVGDLGAAQTRLASWDARFPIGRRLRINPRIRVVSWQSLTDGRERTTVSPSLRLLFSGRRYRLELEAGRDEMTRTIAGSERDASAQFINLGYRASF